MQDLNQILARPTIFGLPGGTRDALGIQVFDNVCVAHAARVGLRRPLHPLSDRFERVLIGILIDPFDFSQKGGVLFGGRRCANSFGVPSSRAHGRLCVPNVLPMPECRGYRD
jgi:hypothetical protein